MDTPRDENGEYDFECLEALDIDLLNQDMTKLLNGERVELPYFNFKTGKREYKGNFIQMKETDVLVLEGIHGLNEKLTWSLPAESKFRIYISALTQINVDEHNRIPTTDRTSDPADGARQPDAGNVGEGDDCDVAVGAPRRGSEYFSEPGEGGCDV